MAEGGFDNPFYDPNDPSFDDRDEEMTMVTKTPTKQLIFGRAPHPRAFW